ncbi:MAG: NAD(P)-dependent alcohol dehydrogenase [Novosphingobium sp.]|jgi:aryl-alcohol dehydrogenase|nr:NAD(P)-dependent alcohol dehydrogenase [Novosphingobium sp.]
MQARAALLNEPDQPFTIAPVEIDTPEPDEILVRIAAVGICHTDMIFATGAMGNAFPLILGHEGAGTVEAIGSEVTKAAPGDKVLLTFASCGHCRQCASHNPAYCDEFTALNFAAVRADGTSPVHAGGRQVSARFFGQSSFSSHAIANERNIVVLPGDADLAALAPLGCGIQTGVGGVLRSLGAEPGSTLVVMGGGAVGLSAVLGGVLADCATIILIEPRAGRRELGLALGAHHVIDPGVADTAAAVRALVPSGVNYVFDTSGSTAALAAAIGMLAPRGTLGMVGIPGALDAVLPLPIVAAITYGFTVRGIIEGDSDPGVFLPELVALFRKGRLPYDRFVRYYPFEQINRAFQDSRSGACVKAVLLLDAAASTS